MTNDFILTGGFTNEDDIPTFLVARNSGNPTSIFTGLITVQCPEWRLNTGSGGNDQNHQFTGGIALEQTTKLLFSGSNNQDLYIQCPITVDAPGYTFTLKTTSGGEGEDIYLETGVTLPADLAFEVEGVNNDDSGLVIDTSLTFASTNPLTIKSGARLIINTQLTTQGTFTAEDGSLIDINNRFRCNSPVASFYNDWGDRNGELWLEDSAGPMVVNLNGDNVDRDWPDVQIRADVLMQRGIGAQDALPVIRSRELWFNGTRTLTLGANVVLGFRSGADFRRTALNDSTINGNGRILLVPNVTGYIVPEEPGAVPVGDGLQLNVNVTISSSASATVPTDAIYTLRNQSQLKALELDNDAATWTLIAQDLTMETLIRDTNIDGGNDAILQFSGAINITTIWCMGDDAQFTAGGVHRVEFLDASVVTVTGEFRPGTPLSSPSSTRYNTDYYMGAGSQLILAGSDGAQIEFLGAVGQNSSSWGYLNFDVNNLPQVIFDLTNQPAVDVIAHLDYQALPYRLIVRNGGTTAVGLDFSDGWYCISLEFPSFGSNGPITINPNGENFPDPQTSHRISAEAGTDVTLRLVGDGSFYIQNLFVEGLQAGGGASINPEVSQDNAYVMDFRNFTDVQWAGQPGFPYIWNGFVPGTMDIWGENYLAEYWNIDLDGQTNEFPCVVHSGFRCTLDFVLWGYSNSEGLLDIREGVQIECDRTFESDPTYPFAAPGLQVMNSGTITVRNTVDLNENVQVKDARRARYWSMIVDVQSSGLGPAVGSMRLFNGQGQDVAPGT